MSARIYSGVIIRAGRIAAIAMMALPGVAVTRGAETRPPAAAPSAAPDRVGFDAFRILSERNIFNPNRVGRTLQGPSVPAQPSGDLVTLVGAMDSDRGPQAFFDSDNHLYRKVLPSGGKIAQYTVGQIANSGVELARDGKSFVLRVGQQLRRAHGGDWAVVETPTSSAAATATSAPAPSTAIPADASDTLKRLMEKRQSQLK